MKTHTSKNLSQIYI